MICEFVLCIKAQDDDNFQAVPILRIFIPKEVLDFYTNVKGWNFFDWAKEKIEKKGINFSDKGIWWLEHPIFTLRRIDKETYSCLPYIKI